MRDSTDVTNLTVRLDNVTAIATGKYFDLCAPCSHFEFVNGTTVASKKMSIGGTDTVCLIDNSTLTIAENFYAPADCVANEGLSVKFKGANPRIVTTGTGDFGVRPFTNSGSTVLFEFDVPVGGYALPPIQTTSTSGNAKFANGNSNAATTPKFELAIGPDSPALKKASVAFTNVLISAAAGFYTNNMVEAIGTLPTHDYHDGQGEIPCGAFIWGKDDAPIADGADITTARQILLDLHGYGKPPMMFLVY